MPRTREFDPEEALSAAMHVFWEKGYNETSYEDLVAGTGVSRKGLYSAFGDKHQLFLAALKNYRATVVPTLLASLDSNDVTRENIRTLFFGLARLAVTTAGRRGCFLVRTSADDAINDLEIHTIIEAHFQDVNNRLQKALLTAGYAPARAKRLGPFLVGVMQGLFTLAHARTSAEIIDPFISEAMTALD